MTRLVPFFSTIVISAFRASLLPGSHTVFCDTEAISLITMSDPRGYRRLSRRQAPGNRWPESACRSRPRTPRSGAELLEMHRCPEPEDLRYVGSPTPASRSPTGRIPQERSLVPPLVSGRSGCACLWLRSSPASVRTGRNGRIHDDAVLPPHQAARSSMGAVRAVKVRSQETRSRSSPGRHVPSSSA